MNINLTYHNGPGAMPMPVDDMPTELPGSPGRAMGPPMALGKGRMGSALTGSLRISCFFDRGTFWVLPLTYFYLPQSAFPQSVKIHYFCSGPIGVDPIRAQPRPSRRSGPWGGRLPASGSRSYCNDSYCNDSYCNDSYCNDSCCDNSYCDTSYCDRQPRLLSRPTLPPGQGPQQSLPISPASLRMAQALREEKPIGRRWSRLPGFATPQGRAVRDMQRGPDHPEGENISR